MVQDAAFPLAETHKSYLSTVRPWYYRSDAQLCGVMTDFWLSLLGPIITYWLLSAFFEILDRANWEWLRKYRIHESTEVASRNRVTKEQVLVAVVVQQVIQVALGYLWMDENGESGGLISTHVPRMEVLAPTVLRFLGALVGRRFAAYVWLHKAQDLVYYAYWWAIPLAQLLAGL